MQFTIEKPDLVAAMAQVTKVIGTRPSIPIIAHVLIEAAGDKVTFCGTDMDARITVRKPAAVATDGRTTVSAARLQSIATNAADGAQLTLTNGDDGTTMTVRSGRSRYKLSTLPADDFPSRKEEDFAINTLIGAAALKRAIERTSVAVSTDETRFYLNGIYIHQVEDKLRFAATNSMIISSVDLDHPCKEHDWPALIFPRQAIRPVLGLLDGDEVTVRASETCIEIEAADTTFWTRAIDATYPDYERVIPTECEVELQVDCEALRHALKRAGLAADPGSQSERGGMVSVEVKDQVMTLRSHGAQADESEDGLIVAFDGELFFGVNERFLSNIADTAGSDDISIGFNGPTSPILITSTDEVDTWRGVVALLRISQSANQGAPQ